MNQVDELGPGEIGFITAAIKEVADTRVGDTITDDRKPVTKMLPGFKPAIPVVFCGLFPVDANDFETLRAAMGKLRLNDASFSFFFQAEDGIRDGRVTGVQTCALPILFCMGAPVRAQQGSPPQHAQNQRALSTPDSASRSVVAGGTPSVQEVEVRRVRISKSEERRVGKECRSRWSA